MFERVLKNWSGRNSLYNVATPYPQIYVCLLISIHITLYLDLAMGIAPIGSAWPVCLSDHEPAMGVASLGSPFPAPPSDPAMGVAPLGFVWPAWPSDHELAMGVAPLGCPLPAPPSKSAIGVAPLGSALSTRLRKKRFHIYTDMCVFVYIRKKKEGHRDTKRFRRSHRMATALGGRGDLR